MAEALIEMSRKGFGVVGVVDAAGRARRHRHRRRPPPAHGRACSSGGSTAVMTPGAADDRDDGARLRGARGDEREEDHHALRHRPGGAGAAGRASCTSTTACAPASSEPMAAGPGLHSRVVAILKVGLPLVALGLLPALFLVPDRRPAGRRRRLLAGRRRGARQRACRSPTRPSPAPPAAATASASPPTLVVPDAAPPERAAITTLAGDARAARRAGGDGRAPTTGDLDIPTQRLDLAGEVRHRDLGRLPHRRRARRRSTSGPAPSSPATRSRAPGRSGAITSGSLHVAPAAATGEARRFSFGDGVRLLYDPPDAGVRTR